jgi:hypothetical protein
VNKKILNLVSSYKQSKYKGPDLSERKRLFEEAKKFWDFAISNVKEYKDYFFSHSKLENYRNLEHDKPINLLFVPIGQKFLAEIYCHFIKKGKIDVLIKNINKIDFDLKTGHYTKLFYNPTKNTMIMNSQTVAKKMTLYLLGEDIDTVALKLDLCKAYGINELSEEFHKFKLPPKL